MKINQAMSEQPPAPPPPYPPPKSGMSAGAKAAIIVGAILAVIIVALIASAFIVAQPSIHVTDAHAYSVEDCGFLGSRTTRWSFSATLVNTGGRGYAEVAYQINSTTVTSNNYFVNSQSSLLVSASVDLSVCHVSKSSTFDIVVLSQTQ